MYGVYGILKSPKRVPGILAKLKGEMLHRNRNGSPGSQAKVGGRTGARSTETKEEAENQWPELSKSQATVNASAKSVSWECTPKPPAKVTGGDGGQDEQGQGPQWRKEQRELNQMDNGSVMACWL